MATFVLEIGSEELPARFLKSEQAELKKKFSEALETNSLEYDKIFSYATPRRAVVLIKGLKPFQTEKVTVIQGPAKKIAFNENGEPGRALQGFLASNDAAISDISITSTEKGEYVVLRKTIGGKSAGEILADICHQIIASIPFAKSMRWGDHHFLYARPIRWIVALLDNEIIPFSLEHLSSGRETYGHRVHGAGPFSIADAEDFEKTISDSCKVILDPSTRRDIIVNKGNEEAEKHQGKVIWIDSLLDEVEGLVETPVPILGEFDKKFLELPREVLLYQYAKPSKKFRS